MNPTDRLFFLDTETAGIDMPPCEVGIIETDHNLNVIQEWQSLIDPQVPIKASASAIHGLLNEDVAESPTLEQWSMMTPNPLLYGGASQPWIIAHKARFDFGVMGKEIPADARMCCTLKIARRLYPNLANEGENHQLQTLAYMFGLFDSPALAAYDGSAHRVGFDIRCCIGFLQYLMAARELSLDYLLELGSTPYPPETPMWFGKHVGTPIKDVIVLDPGYIRWCRSAPNMDPDLIEALALACRV